MNLALNVPIQLLHKIFPRNNKNLVVASVYNVRDCTFSIGWCIMHMVCLYAFHVVPNCDLLSGLYIPCLIYHD
jgi:hypothetical protein